MTTDVQVYVDIDDDTVHAGHLYPHRRRQSESASFAYTDTYLTRPDAYALDPALQLVSGTQHTPLGVRLFRALADTSPDRWGRNLVLRAERVRARARDARTTTRSFGDFDLLLGVRDDLRQGALRLRTAADHTFLAPEASGVPQLTDLPSLLRAADRVASDDADDDQLMALLRAGSSLGGARPKAHVLDTSGRLSIAKFPSPASDGWNVMAWEKTALDLAAKAGIEVPNSTLVKVADRDVLVVGRFDRAGRRRIGYCSAMTMLEAADGDVRSYVDIAEVVEERSLSTTRHLHQLWRRVAFSVLISNTDDHLRNHGFLHVTAGQWLLSPAFDLNPNPDPGPKHLSTAIDGDDTAASIDLLMQVAPVFRLGPDRARAVLAEVVDAHTRWPAVAASYGLAPRAIADMAPAFEHAQAERARAVARG